MTYPLSARIRIMEYAVTTLSGSGLSHYSKDLTAVKIEGNSVNSLNFAESFREE